MSVYLMSIYGAPTLRAKFERAYRATGKKLDVGKSCIRFKSLDDLPLDLIGRAVGEVNIDAFVEMVQAAHGKKSSPARRSRLRSTSRAKKRRA